MSVNIASEDVENTCATQARSQIHSPACSLRLPPYATKEVWAIDSIFMVNLTGDSRPSAWRHHRVEI
jgi:hypothetical protein